MGIIIAERINASRSRIAAALERRDARWIHREAGRQAAAGATHIDINAGSSPRRELDDMRWLAEVVQSATALPLSVDTADPQVAAAALALAKQPPVINSISGEKTRLEGMVPLLAASSASTVALCMDDSGLPEDAEGRVRVARAIFERLAAAGIAPERIYFDPLVRPLATNPEQVPHFLEAVRRIHSELPDVHTICGLSNISFGLPARRNLNRAFMALAIAAGMDSFILDPTEEGVMAAYHAARALAGCDQFGLEYIRYFRSQA